jgi:hypothetical protein
MKELSVELVFVFANVKQKGAGRSNEAAVIALVFQ